MNLRAIWAFIAGDSRRGPALAATAIVLAVLLVRYTPIQSAVIGVIFFAAIALALAASVFEKV